MQNDKISVIVPVYNVKNYLRECLDSIINQTYQNIEVIVVDDGSTDGSSDICDEYSNKDKRVKVHHKINGGAASARNLALSSATGDYLAFVDSDDYIDSKMFEIMLEYLHKYSVDVVQCNHIDVYKNKLVDRIFNNETIEMSGKEYLERILYSWPFGMACNKLCKRSIFDGVYYEEGHIIDDEFFTYKGIMNADKILLVPDALYFYRKRRSSVMQSPNTQERIIFDTLDYLQKRRDNVIEKYPDLSKEYNNAFSEMLLILQKKNGNTDESRKVISQLMRKEIKRKGIRFELRIEMAKRLLNNKSNNFKNNDSQNNIVINEYFE